MHTLSEPQSEITHRLRDALNLDPLVIHEGVVLGRDACVVDHSPGVRCQARHGAPQVVVDFHYFLYGAGFKQGRLDALFDGEDDAVRSADAHCG